MTSDPVVQDHRAETIRRAVAWARHASRVCERPVPGPGLLLSLAAARMRYLALLLPAEARGYMELARFFDRVALEPAEAGVLVGEWQAAIRGQ